MVWVDNALDASRFELSEFMRKRKDANDIPLAKELIINSFFRSIRKEIGEDVLTRDEEILIVLDCMRETMRGTEDELAETLSQYVGVRV